MLHFVLLSYNSFINNNSGYGLTDNNSGYSSTMSNNNGYNHFTDSNSGYNPSVDKIADTILSLIIIVSYGLTTGNSSGFIK